MREHEARQGASRRVKGQLPRMQNCPEVRFSARDSGPTQSTPAASAVAPEPQPAIAMVVEPASAQECAMPPPIAPAYEVPPARDAPRAVPNPVAYVFEVPPVSATLTAVPLSAAVADARDPSADVAPQLALPSTRIWLADGGDTHVTGAAFATPAPANPAATKPLETAKTAAVRDNRLADRERPCDVEVNGAERTNEEKAENNRGSFKETKWVGAAHRTPVLRCGHQ